MSELFEGRLTKYGIQDSRSLAAFAASGISSKTLSAAEFDEETGVLGFDGFNARCLTDGSGNFLVAIEDPERAETVAGIENFVLGNYAVKGWPQYILQAIANEFGVNIFSKYDADSESPPCYDPRHSNRGRSSGHERRIESQGRSFQ